MMPTLISPRTWRHLRRGLLLLGLIAAGVWAVGHWPDGPWWAQQRSNLLALQAAHPWGVGLGLVAGMTLLSALALPGNAPLALAAGLCFGVPLGTAIIVFGSTLGASLAFMAARWWWRARCSGDGARSWRGCSLRWRATAPSTSFHCGWRR